MICVMLSFKSTPTTLRTTLTTLLLSTNPTTMPWLAEVHLSKYFVQGTAEKQSAEHESMTSSLWKMWPKVGHTKESMASVCTWQGDQGKVKGRTRSKLEGKNPCKSGTSTAASQTALIPRHSSNSSALLRADCVSHK